jgi:predicted dehydrogenase
MGRKILIFGLGRMGITHYAILNQLLFDANFLFVDPDIKMTYFAKKNLIARVTRNSFSVDEKFDFALICTPPMYHIPILKECIVRKIPNIFVEKPFGGVNDDFTTFYNYNQCIAVGYVLRFNPVIQLIKESIDLDQVVKVEGYYFSNTIEKKPKGWRNGVYSGVTNEVGAHIIDLCVFLFGLSDPSIINVKTKSIISDVDDILTADLMSKTINYHFHFDWVNKQYRKPVFRFVVTLRNGITIKFDQQKVEYFENNILTKSMSTVDICSKVSYYLRGVDFTRQMQDFIGNKSTIATLNDALITRDLIKKLISK